MHNFTLPSLILTVLVLTGISHHLLVGPPPHNNKTTPRIILPLQHSDQPLDTKTNKQAPPASIPSAVIDANTPALSVTLSAPKAKDPTHLDVKPGPMATLTTSNPPAGSPASLTKPAASLHPEVASNSRPIPANLPQARNNQYLIQLIGSPDNSDIQRFLRLHKPSLATSAPINKISIQRDGSTWYLLLMGPYDGYRATKNAFDKLPDTIQKYEPWLRKADSLPTRRSSQTIPAVEE